MAVQQTYVYYSSMASLSYGSWPTRVGGGWYDGTSAGAR